MITAGPVLPINCPTASRVLIALVIPSIASGYAAEANNIANFDYLGIIITRDAGHITQRQHPGHLFCLPAQLPALLTLGGLLRA